MVCDQWIRILKIFEFENIGDEIISAIYDISSYDEILRRNTICRNDESDCCPRFISVLRLSPIIHTW